MSFELDTTGTNQNTSGGGDTKKIDYDAMNLEVIEAVGTQNKAKTVAGYVVAMYDLGMQPRANFEKLYDPSKPKEVKAVEEGNATVETRDRFYDNNTLHTNVEVFSQPRTPAKAFAMAVDFPQYTVDKGKYFGNSNPAPLRLIMGGNWSVANPDVVDKKMPIIQNPFYLAENTNNPQNVWALPTTSTLSKMGLAAGEEEANGLVKAASVSKLLGKAFMFNIQVFNKASKKDASKFFYTEKIKFVSEIPEGMSVPEGFDPSTIHGINMNKSNSEESLKQVRAIIKNTMRLSESWEGSVIQGELSKGKEENNTSSTPEPQQAPAIRAEPTVEDFDEDCPF